MKLLALIGTLTALLLASFHLFSLDQITRVTGVVTGMSADSITLDTAEDRGEGVTIGILRSTLFIQDGQSASWRDLRVGARVDVDATSNENPMYAIDVVFEKPPVRGPAKSSPRPGSRSHDAYRRFGNRWPCEADCSAG